MEAEAACGATVSMLDAMHQAVWAGSVVGATLVGVSRRNALVGGSLYLLCYDCPLRPVLFVSWRAADQQVSERIDDYIGVAALAPRSPVIAGLMPALGRALLGARIGNYHAWARQARLLEPQHIA